MSHKRPRGMGWQPDLPDARDYNTRSPLVTRWLEQLPTEYLTFDSLPVSVDLRRDEDGCYFPSVADQGTLNASVAFAVIGLVEYFQRRIQGIAFHGSTLFLYKTTRNLLDKGISTTNDRGVDLRSTLKSLVRCGVPAEDYWPYEVERFAVEPESFFYAAAERFPDLTYFRLDTPNADGQSTWRLMKSFLAAGFPVAFGFSVPASLTEVGEILYRPELDAVLGGQAVVAVGYQEQYFGPGRDAILIRSSWGSQWGDHGYGWLPAAFVTAQLARDFWTLISPRWVGTAELTRPVIS
ncbi:MAG: C1 family peptidase [Pirellulaceae bacterium]|nr:C1 family peptidase [Pirellulaceae bacterium]